MDTAPDRIYTVLRAVESFSVCTTVDALGVAVMKQLAEHLGVRGGSAYIRENEELRLICGWGPRHAPSRIPLPLRPTSPMAQCMSRRQPLLLGQKSWSTDFAPSGWNGYTDDQALLVPFFDHTRSLSGVVSLHNKIGGIFCNEDIQLAKLLVTVGSEALRTIQSHEAVSESESRMRNLFEHLPGMAYHCTDVFAWQMTFMSQGCHSVTGYRPSDLMSREDMHYGSLIVPEDLIRVEEEILNAMAGRRILDTTYRIRTAEGQERWVWHKGAGNLDDRGFWIGMDGFVTDITAQRALERRLAEIATALDQANEAVLITTLKGVVLYANATFERLCGPTAPIDGVSRSHWLPIDVPEDHPAYLTLLESEKEGKPCKVEVPGRNQSGSRTQLRIQFAPYRAEDGTLMQYVYLVSDVSEEHKLRAQLLQAQKLEAIGSLASGIAHEINTPVQYIGDNLLFIQESMQQLGPVLEAVAQNATPVSPQDLQPLLANADWPFLRDEIPKALQESIAGNRRVTEIVRAMKAFAHPDDEDFHPADINQALQTTATVARNEWKYVSDLALDLSNLMPRIPCQVGALNQVFLNLIINAAHAIGERIEREKPKKKGQITVSTRHCDPWAEIVIRDTGAGIPAAILSKIFDPFFTTKATGKGTGQGLALAHSVVVERHGGTIDVESVEGQGTSILVKLPLRRD